MTIAAGPAPMHSQQHVTTNLYKSVTVATRTDLTTQRINKLIFLIKLNIFIQF